MDKRLFQLRHRLHQQITGLLTLLLALPLLLEAQESSRPVYQDTHVVGYLYHETTLNGCGDCYTLDTIVVWGRQVVIRLEVTLLGMGNGMYRLARDVEMQEEPKPNKHEYCLQFNSTQNASWYELYIRRNKQGAPYLHRKQSFDPQALVDRAIGDHDRASFPCTHICTQVIQKELEGTIDFTEIFFAEPGNDHPENCFDCPLQYTWEKCLQMKAKNKPFIWKPEP